MKTDALGVRTTSAAVPGMAGGEAKVTRLRLGLEGSWRLRFEDGASLTPSVVIGARHDGGDAEAGFGADIGGGLAFADPARGVSFALNARGLLAHEADGFGAWGVSGSLAFDSDPASERGLTLTLRQTAGASSTGGADALFGRATMAGLGSGDSARARRLDAEAGYGLPVFGGRFTGTPWLGFALSEDGRDYRLGWRLRPARQDRVSSFDLGIEATRRERSNDDTAEHGIGLRLSAHW